MAVYLVTGAAGFIGSWLTQALVERGETVRALDNFSTGKRENLAPWKNDIEILEVDLRDEDRVAQACKGVDIIFHEGAIPSVPLSVKDPRTSHTANIDGTFNLLEGARHGGVKRVVYAASSSAYGNRNPLPQIENMLPGPLSPYAVQKLVGELYLRSYWEVYGLETVALRYFNIFGPRQAPDSPYSGVMAKFATMMLEGEQPVIHGDGEQSRDFTYVENVVQANMKAAAGASGKSGGTHVQLRLRAAVHAEPDLQADCGVDRIQEPAKIWPSTGKAISSILTRISRRRGKRWDTTRRSIFWKGCSVRWTGIASSARRNLERPSAQEPKTTNSRVYR